MSSKKKNKTSGTENVPEESVSHNEKLKQKIMIEKGF